MRLWTIGHSNHPLERFVELLAASDIDVLVDVRTVPKSRKWPHFRDDALAVSLPSHGVGYLHMAGLGGWRRPDPASPNRAWRNESFRGYADYALTEEFAAALAALAELAASRRTAIMCSEALWWRCHRRLIADRLVADGWEVLHIGTGATAQPHRLADFGVVEGGRVVYPEPAA